MCLPGRHYIAKCTTYKLFDAHCKTTMTIKTDEILGSPEEHPPCEFPCLGALPSEPEWLRQKLDVSMGRLLTEACAQYDTTLDFVLGTIWAIILQRFTLNERVGFSILHRRKSDAAARTLLKEPTQLAYSWRTFINRERPIGDLMKVSGWQQLAYDPDIDSFNTSIVIDEDANTIRQV